MIRLQYLLSVLKVNQQITLNDVVIARPCSMKWETMQGDDRRRVCGGCSKSVFNLSDMTKAEATAFLAEYGLNECMTFYRRDDGTIMTDNCPRALRPVRNFMRKAIGVVAATMTALFALSPAAHSQVRGKPAAVRGEVMPEPVHSQINGGAPAPMHWIEPVPATPTQVLLPGQMISTRPVALPTDTNKKLSTTANPHVKLRAEYNLYMETKANEFFQKGKAAQAAGKKSLAEFYFEKALKEFDSQKTKGDVKFREVIEAALKEVAS